jgi:hypothetical protein
MCFSRSSRTGRWAVTGAAFATDEIASSASAMRLLVTSISIGNHEHSRRY